MRPTRLAVSIYLVALVQLLTAWLGFSVSRDYLVEPPGRLGRGGFEAFAAQHVAFDRQNPAALKETMEWLRVELGIAVTMFSPDGQVMASNHAVLPAPLSRAEAERLPTRDFLPGPRPNTFVVGIHEAGQLVAYVITDGFQFRRPLSRQVVLAVVILLIVLAASLLFARSVAGPLKRLAQVARAFGGGDLRARMRLNRPDELGAVATAFDDMADRITALLQSQRELLANVSHELRTPLSRIRVALDLATDGDAEAARDALANINTDFGDLDRLVEDVLAAARLDLGASVPGGLPLRKDPIVLTDFVAAVAARFLLLYPSERLDLQVEPGLPALEGDGAMLRRVVDNLIDNARKYSETNSPITLSVRRDGASVCLAVVDHGMGIEPADLPHIFTPFFRADRSRTRKTGGVGMGLTLVRRIVVAHGGSIEVKSEVGVGTQAYVRLPGLIQADPSHGATSAPPRTLPPQTSHTGAA